LSLTWRRASQENRALAPSLLGKLQEDHRFPLDVFLLKALSSSPYYRLTFWIPTSIVKGFVLDGLGQSKGRKAPSTRHDPGPALFPRPLL
jgi:hypothetical protein